MLFQSFICNGFCKLFLQRFLHRCHFSLHNPLHDRLHEVLHGSLQKISASAPFLQRVSATVPKSVVLPGYARILRAGHTTTAPFAEPDALACRVGHASSVRTQRCFLQFVSANVSAMVNIVPHCV